LIEGLLKIAFNQEIEKSANQQIIPADVAQLVERFLGKEEVTGSTPVIGSD
jgi:hypothetical protein